MHTPTTTPAKIALYCVLQGPNRHVWSPFVNKLETRLRLAAVPYRLGQGSMRQAPRGKIPYISLDLDDNGSDSEMLGDTSLIIKRLCAEGVMPDLNDGLSAGERAVDVAVRALLEERLAFFLTRERWIDNYYTMRAGALAALPWAMRFIVGNLAYAGVKRTLYGQGTGRYTDDEMRGMKREAWETLNALLVEAKTKKGDMDREGPFWVLGREAPTEADATVYGFVVASLICPAAPETQKMVRSFPVLVDYARSIHARYFSDYDLWDDEI
ncbi:hypothetical protein B0T22DRAFT_434070 [Podospora appendiculata]|uniref:Thioredoxin-like fold domain-containing protein n=1 Tax=Podospora appendiculata TaxID=314037 RepID=A0AAE0X025_9PEZI|nr:hypothetical protein B0T22DRAFT_434070 [Podospora appendiculata]